MTDYSYLNARICSMRRTLLPSTLIEELLTYRDVRTLAERLLDTPYRTGLATSLAQQHPLSALDAALDESLQCDAKRVLQLAGGRAAGWVTAFVADWDAQCVKTVVRGLHRQKPGSQIMTAVGPTALLDREAVVELASQPDVRSVVALLLSWSSPWGSALKPVLRSYEAEQDLSVLEHALDSYRFESAYKLQRGFLTRDSLGLELIAAEAELVNVVQCLMHVTANTETRLVPTFGNPSRTVRALLKASSMQDAVVALAESPYRKVFDRSLPFMTHAGHVGMFERMLRRELLVQSRRLSVREPLSIAVACHYLRSKRNEIINIKLIAHGIENQVPENSIKAGLVSLSEEA